uniref:Uncharacterized protein n=1 Tax=Faxonius propinquus nudivirus TaxID=3139431 RepID=A0AAU8GC38_9VIRU
MKLDATYLDNLIDKKVIPLSAWYLQLINNEECFTIKNQIYCIIFWMDLWYNVLINKFKDQNMINNIEKLDLTRPVIITSSLVLLSAQPIVQNIDYFSTKSKKKNPPFFINISIFTVFILIIIVYVFIIILSLFNSNKINIYIV